MKTVVNMATRVDIENCNLRATSLSVFYTVKGHPRKKSWLFIYYYFSRGPDPSCMRSNFSNTSSVRGSAFSRAENWARHTFRLSRKSCFSFKNWTKSSCSKACSRSSTSWVMKKWRMQRGTVSQTFILITLKQRTTFFLTLFISSSSWETENTRQIKLKWLFRKTYPFLSSEVPQIKIEGKHWLSSCKILENKKEYVKELGERFNLNGHTIEVYLKTWKLQPVITQLHVVVLLKRLQSEWSNSSS